jgi:Leucine-rich repeat (LRR) protein
VGDKGLAHIKDCKNLTHLSLDETKISNEGLTNLKGCKELRTLMLAGTKVGDAGLAHLKDCKNLTYLSLSGTLVTDLSLLKGMPLKELTCDFRFDRDADLLRSIMTLESINGKRAKQFWADVDAKKP